MPRLALLAAVLCLTAAAAQGSIAHAANRAPDCHGTTTAVTPGGERSFAVHCADDFDGPGRSTVEVVEPPAHGDLVALGGLQVRYTPHQSHAGEDAFTFRVTDGASQTATLTQELRVTDENLAPRCLPLHIVGAIGLARLHRACYDPNPGDAARPSVTTPPAHGQIGYFDGLAYSPDPGYVGPDSFSLEATDGSLTGAATDVDVEVQPAAPPECDTPPVEPVRPGTTDQIRLACRDNGAAEPLTYTFRVLDEPGHGQVDHDPRGGWFAYTSEPGFEGPDSFTVVAASHHGGEGAPVTVTLAVDDDANQAPSCSVAGDLLRLRSGTTRTLTAWCADPDRDRVETTYGPGPAHGALADGGFGGDTYTADEEYAGPDEFAVLRDDGRVQAPPMTQRVEVVGDGENTVPACAPGLRRVRNDRTTSVLLNCEDPEHDPLTFTWEDPAHGDVAEGVVGWPFFQHQLVYTPDDGYTGTDVVRFRARDDHGGESAWTSTLVDVVAPAPPTCRPRPHASVRPGRQLNMTLECVADDAYVHPTVHAAPEHGTLEAWGSGMFVYHPDDGFEGLDSFTLRAENAYGSDLLVQEIEVDPDSNHAPSCLAWEQSTRGAPVTLTVECHDNEDDPITLSAVEGPAHGELGAWDQGEGKVVYTPDEGFVGVDDITVSADDGRGSTLVDVHVQVRRPDANYVPRCQAGGAAMSPGQSAGFTPVCSDRDGDPVTVAVAELPEHGVVSGPDGTGKFTYTPDPGFVGADRVGIVASDAHSTSPVVTMDMTVGGSGFGAPRCVAIAANVRHETPRRVRLQCTSGFGETATPVVQDGPDHGALGPIGDRGWVTYTPAAGFSGTDSFTYRGEHGGATGVPQTVELRVAAGSDEEPEPPPPADPPPPPPADPPPPPPPPPPGPDPAELAAEQRLGGDAVPLPGLRLGTTRVFVPAGAGGGPLLVDGPTEKLLALVCAGACDVTAGQQLTLGAAGARAAAVRPIRLRTQRMRLRAGQAGVVVLRLTKAQRRRIRRAHRATLRVTLTVKDAAGRTTRGAARFRLRAR